MFLLIEIYKFCHSQVQGSLNILCISFALYLNKYAFKSLFLLDFLIFSSKPYMDFKISNIMQRALMLVAVCL